MFKTVHKNSYEAFHSLDRETRRKYVLSVYKNATSPLTDRQVADRLGFADMNMVRPRISELKKMKILKEIGKVKDYKTNKSVRVLKVIRPEESVQGELF